jgi:hypothetical protein
VGRNNLAQLQRAGNAAGHEAAAGLAFRPAADSARTETSA